MANAVTYSKLWEPTQIGATASTIYTATTSSTAGVVKNLSAVICNTTSTGVTIELWVVPFGGTAGDSNKLLNAEVVPGNDRLSFSIPDMKQGDFISANASVASSLTIHAASGIIIN